MMPAELQLPHWLILAGACLVVLGTFGLLIRGRQRR